ncbi:glucose/quinate/shikimate family membrane-bound PQQ-dependent dehydrogenase [Alteraurantiacibacter aestuarii]|uniref:PQQ-binding-like beta-propeller repeat protein n=1 Tax=Alteraurantiacibacter aestuarii TaxID=650004 RepID=A0A844ZJP9_9SPHN|nr:PQQ-binding-like beta-propeller repeat protein [Alteraurantiacibacter aestuarii]MXO87250.1 PQQ-binding-like beta-propeller repeat protein [Alteraurantiacibacter aestuarii]
MRAYLLLAACAALLTPVLPAQANDAEAAPGNWVRYARDASGTRFSPLDQINVANVGDLQQAWSVRLRPDGGGGLLGGTVPIVVDGIMYLPTGNGVIALEAHTGRELWHHVPDGALIRRAVSWWPGDGATGPRIFYSFGSGIRALDARTGEVDRTFGDNGEILFGGTPYSYPPSIFGNVMVIGANTAEMPRGPSGNSRAYDARTGRKLWEFNTVPQPGEVGHETWLDDGWQGRSGTNMWIWYTTADLATNTVYMTIGGPSPNYYGGDRPGNNLFGNSVVAVDLDTGAYKWHFQTIHHDLWDWDLPAPPVLFDAHVDGRTIPALAQTGKPGLMYILNRETGEPIHGVNEMRVAAGDVPGEWYSPIQPIPVRPAALSRMWWDPSDVVTAQDTNADHAAACRALLDSYGGSFFNSGPFTPFFLHEEGDEPRASINLPHNGGSNWGGSAADPQHGIVYINTSESGSIGWIEGRNPGGDYGRGTADSSQRYDRGSLVGPGAYSSFSANFVAEDGSRTSLPCIRPPWGRLHAVDANTGNILWSTPLGTTPMLPEGKQDTGSNNTFGGPMATAGGLVFIGATSDAYFRAFDAANGQQLWSEKLPYAPLTVPMSFLGSDGRQYVAVIAAGSSIAGPPPRGEDGRPVNGEALIAFAVPE